MTIRIDFVQPRATGYPAAWILLSPTLCEPLPKTLVLYPAGCYRFILAPRIVHSGVRPEGGDKVLSCPKLFSQSLARRLSYNTLFIVCHSVDIRFPVGPAILHIPVRPQVGLHSVAGPLLAADMVDESRTCAEVAHAFGLVVCDPSATWCVCGLSYEPGGGWSQLCCFCTSYEAMLYQSSKPWS